MFKNIFEYVQEHILICSGIIDAVKDVGHKAPKSVISDFLEFQVRDVSRSGY